MVTHSPPSPIAFVDLAAQQSRIRERLDRAIARVLDHGQYIMGPEVKEFEANLRDFTGARHAITCSSGTDALLIAMMALNVGPGDAILCPAFTYTATPETIGLLGATPVFVDVDPVTFNIDPAGVEAGIQVARSHGLKPVGMIAVDLFGQLADYEVLAPLAADAGLFVLCDAAQAFGAARGGVKVGTFGAVTTTSFFPAKPLGCYGDGGAIFTNDDALALAMASIRLHGKANGTDKYAIDRIGLNGRLDTLQAAILIEKLAIFADELQLREHVARRYSTGLSHLPLTTPSVPENTQSAWAQYTLRVEAGRRDELAAQLKASGIPTAVYYPRPLHHQPAYAHFPSALPAESFSEELCSQVLSLPMHPYLQTDQQDYIIGCVQDGLS